MFYLSKHKKELQALKLKVSQLEIKASNGTILDYGAILYKNKEDALNGVSCHKAIQQMVNENQVAMLPSFGWFNLSETVILLRDADCVLSLGNPNLVTKNSNSMFLPAAHDHKIKGFTAHYEDVKKECAVVQYGGDDRNTGRVYINHLGTLMNNFRPRRTQSVANNLDFDLVGKAIGVWVNYNDKTEDKYSRCHFMKVRGTYRNCDTSIKVKRFYKSQSINSMDVKLKVWGANQFAYLKGNINHSKIQILGQETEEHNIPLFEVTGKNLISDIFVYDVAKYNPNFRDREKDLRKGQYNVKYLQLTGLSKLRHFISNKIHKMPNTNFNDSILK